MPSEDISALQSQGLGDPQGQWEANHRSTPGDLAYMQNVWQQMQPAAGEAAPKYNLWGTMPTHTPTYADISGPGTPIDPKTMPASAYGYNFTPVGGSQSGGPSFAAENSGQHYQNNKAVWDPNYGWVVPQSTAKGDLGDWMPQALQAAFSMAAGGFMGLPASLVMAGKGLGNGGSLGSAAMSMLPSLIPGLAGLGGFSLPPELMQALNYAKSGYGLYNAARQNNPISAGMTLGGLANNLGSGGSNG